MSISWQASDGHAHHILDVVSRGADGATSDFVISSWTRCVNQYGLDPARPRSPDILEAAMFRERVERSGDLVQCSRLEMATLYQQLSEPEAAVVLVDADGLILHMVSSPQFARDGAAIGFRKGALWSEDQVGTNGMGTCLVARAPLAIRQDEHFFAPYTELTCAAVPVFDHTGKFAAVLDVTSTSRHHQQHSLALLSITAQTIENRLIERGHKDAYPIHFHVRPEFVNSPNGGKLVVGEDGRICAANRAALSLLGVSSVEALCGRRLDEVFHATLDELLRASVESSFHPVPVMRVNAPNPVHAVAQRPASRVQARAIQRGVEPTPVARGAVGGMGPIGAGLGAGMAAGGYPAAPARDAGNGAPVHVGALSSLQSAASAQAQVAGAEVARVATGRTVVDYGEPRLASQRQVARRAIARGIPVLLHGETGAGKEVFARAIHEDSPCSHGPLVAINCASLPETLIESELFGYSTGAFTGAQRGGRRGRIVQANGGTLFLDEIGDMPLALQARLLRVLDERMVTPLGGEDSIRVEFQLVSASHRHLPDLVRRGLFREDLYYRLCGVEVVLPPLRDRADKAELVRRLLALEGAELRLTPDAEALVLRHPWPGNVRQLRHVLRTAAALSEDGLIGPEHMPTLGMAPPSMTGMPAAPTGPMRGMYGDAGREAHGGDLRDPSMHEAMMRIPSGYVPDDAQRQLSPRDELLRALELHRWNISAVAKHLDISRNTLYRRMRNAGIPLQAEPEA
ncbi:sigma-54-dependent Fis family transcriptional regulator [Derxia gummosa]|uniref:Sigma-54-dependent Fis family transcriptional regulator n=1 Tax=Derxia gummosa DSM 723 TaxID=1121388 RepID=A0A8B6X377_9BURK|nr:sigma-54-dependent Fis family transcriptional regulator [Derxia gummosa]